MATVTAFIVVSDAVKNKDKKKANVRFRLTDGRDFKSLHKSEISVINEQWDEKQQKIKARCLIDENERVKFDKAVNERKALINEIYKEKGKTLTSDLLNIEIDKILHPKKYDAPIQSFFEIFDEFLQKQKSELSKVRYNHYKVVFRCLKRFEMYTQKYSKQKSFKLELDTITPDTLQAFSDYLEKEHELFKEYLNLSEKKRDTELSDKELELFDKHSDLFNKELYTELSDNKKRKQSELQPRGQNTIKDILKKLRTFLLWCKKKAKKTTNDPFDDFKIGECKYGTPYYITIDERNQLYNLDLSLRPELERQRDIFVFQCLIGCRIGDLYNFTKANIINNEVHYIARKTKDDKPETVRVPLSTVAKEILNKYANYEGKELFPFISQQKYNDNIKKAFAVAGITRSVVIRDPLTSENVIRPINEVASSHLARRCFVGNMYKKVKDQNLVAALSGHVEGSRAFARYREIDEDMRKELVSMIE